MAATDNLLPGDKPVSGARSRDRAVPAAADAIAFTGGAGVAVGVLLLTIDLHAHGHGRLFGVVLFAALLGAAYLAISVLPREVHPAAVTVVVASVPGMFGWWILPHAHRFADVRPFLILVFIAWTVCWLAPLTRGRTIFVAAALIVLWLWMLGEVAGTDAYSAAPVPSPPAHTTFSLSALTSKPAVVTARATRSSAITISGLDPTSPLYPLARQCAAGLASACDELFAEAPPGSDFQELADSCAGTQPVGSGGECAVLEQRAFETPTPSGVDLVPGGSVFGGKTNDRPFEIGFVSLLFGIAYVGAIAALDRRRRRGLGTALVLPGLLALFTGTEVLGNAAHHAWVGGLLTFAAGIAFAIVGDYGGRRFTAWGGAALAAFGLYTFAADIANFDHSFSDSQVNLVRPALVTLGFGVLLVALAWGVARVRAQYPRGVAAVGTLLADTAEEPADDAP
jgi:hypothetical protein